MIVSYEHKKYVNLSATSRLPTIHVETKVLALKRILSPMMWFGHRSCQILSVNGTCPSLVICAVLTPVKTTPELSGPAFRVLPKTGDEELEYRGRPGWERLRMICARSTSAWRRQDGAMDRPAWRVHVDAARSSWHAPERESIKRPLYLNAKRKSKERRNKKQIVHSYFKKRTKYSSSSDMLQNVKVI